MEEIVEVVQIRTKERVQNRTVKQIVEVVHSIPSERIPEIAVEQIVDMQEPQVMKKTSRVPKITKENEYTQYQLQLVRIQQRIVEQVVDTHVQPTVNPVDVKQPKIFKIAMQRKHPSVRTKGAK